MNGRTEGAVPQVKNASIVCSRCEVRIDLSQPLPLDGWQTIHVCGGRDVQAFTVAPGREPWAWRAVDDGG